MYTKRTYVLIICNGIIDCSNKETIRGGKHNMSKPPSRTISVIVERQLWAMTAGRCQFEGCNRKIYKSSITQEDLNVSQKAHIYSYSEDGPRGWGPYKDNLGDLNSVANLMLLCPECHLKIDCDDIKYPGSLLTRWKKDHEDRIGIVTGIASNKKSHVVFYTSNIGHQKSPIQKNEAMKAMFPGHYPASENPISLSMKWTFKDNSPQFWMAEVENLENEFLNYIQKQIIEKNLEEDLSHFSLFALAPIPLLIKLGTLFTDKINVDVYQLIRQPKTWEWQDFPEHFKFIIKKPKVSDNPPVLVISLSDNVNYERITSVLGDEVSIWELTVPDKFIGNDNIRSKAQLSMFRTIARSLMINIKEKHGFDSPLSIFPAMGISCSVELGRIRMPKADMPWIIYDQNNEIGSFIETIRIGGTE